MFAAKRSALAVLLSTGLVWPLLAADKPSADKSPPAGKELFDGKSLAGWKVTDFGGEGKVEVRDKTVVMAKGSPMTGITFSGKLPKSNYELTLEGKRVEGSDFFCTTTFPVGDKCCSFVTGGWGGTIVGLSNVNSENASANATTKTMDFDTGRWYKFRLRVTKDRIRAWIDDEQVVDLDTEDRKITLHRACDPCKPFGFATWKTTGAVRAVRVRRLTAAEAKPAPEKKDGE
jgi:Domain of Unknown Function (DUF1080)